MNIFNNYELVVFDWEGTLSDPLGHVHAALTKESVRLGLPAYDSKLGRQYVSLGLDKAVKKIFPDLTIYQYEALLSGVQQSLAMSHGQIFLFPGAQSLVTSLFDAGVKLAIATNKGEQSLLKALQTTALASYFSYTASATQYAAKPCPDMLEAVLYPSAVSAEHALMIGDSVADIEMAKAIHVASIGVDFYYQHTDTLIQAGADRVFHDFDHISRYLGF